MLGIGGIGMSALARYFNVLGKKVSGYDRNSSELTDQLIHEDIAIHFNDSIENIPAYVINAEPSELLIVYTPAIPKDSNELNYLKSKFEIYKRSQVLGFITKTTRTIAVAGTHGKTTTSTMIAHLLHASHANVSAFLGGVSKNLGSNFLLGDSKKPDHYAIVEADEFDRSFLTLFPQTAIITSMDADHLDIYDTHQNLIDCYNQFANQISSDGLLVIKEGLNITTSAGEIKTYSSNGRGDCSAQNIAIINNEYVFDYVSKDRTIRGLKLGLPGRHNVENAIAAITSVINLELNDDQIRNGLASYTGVKRRFDYQIKTTDSVFIDDYAHHPEELRAVIKSVKEIYYEKSLTVIFQPHLYSRTRDFADEFASALSMADFVYLLPIYPARELPIAGVTSELIFSKITCNKKLVSKEELLSLISQTQPPLLMTLGAGDIDQLTDPIKHILENKVTVILKSNNS